MADSCAARIFTQFGKGDVISNQRGSIYGYVACDALLYRDSDGTSALSTLEAEHWHPFVEWIGRRLGVEPTLAYGIDHATQPLAFRERFAQEIDAIPDEEVEPFACLVRLSGSPILVLALCEGQCDFQTFWAAACLEETFCENRWGVDEEARARRDSLEAEARAQMERLLKVRKKEGRFSARVHGAAFALLFMSSGALAQAPETGDTEEPFSLLAYDSVALPFEEQLNLNAVSAPSSRIAVRAETAGTVIAREVQKGSRVVRGDLLCQLDVGARDARIEQAQAALEQATFSLRSSEALFENGHVSEAHMKQAQAVRDASRASLVEARLERDRVRILAPAAGLIDGEVAQVGDSLGVGSICASLIVNDPLVIAGKVSEKRVHELAIGMEATASLVSGDLLDGKITFVSANGDPSTRTFRIEVEVPNPGGRLRNGLSGELMIPIRGANAHLIPRAALMLSDQGEVGVMTIGEADLLDFIPVSILSDQNDGYWVQGLPHEARLVVFGQFYVREGQSASYELIQKDDLLGLSR